MTYRQNQAIKNMVENGGNMYRAMIDAGYSHAMAKNPQKLKGAKGVKSLFEEFNLTETVIVEKILYLITSIEYKKALLLCNHVLNLKFQKS